MQMHHHLGDFPRKLEQHAHAVYEYVVCPPVGYPELREEMWCHRYYLRNLCDERFADWPIVEHVPLLQVPVKRPLPSYMGIMSVKHSPLLILHLCGCWCPDTWLAECL